MLLAIIVVSVAVLHGLTGIRIIGVVMLVVPLLSLAWIAGQNADGRPLATMSRRALAFATTELPSYRSEIVLLMMAGFIGTLGSFLLAPLMARSGIDLTGIPAWQILVALVWIVPLAGQIGMNPILSVSLIAPILPEAAAMGVSPSDIVVALTAGWALGGISSPYTATTLLIGSFGKVSALHVGLRWNGVYLLICAAAFQYGWRPWRCIEPLQKGSSQNLQVAQFV